MRLDGFGSFCYQRNIAAAFRYVSDSYQQSIPNEKLYKPGLNKLLKRIPDDPQTGNDDQYPNSDEHLFKR